MKYSKPQTILIQLDSYLESLGFEKTKISKNKFCYKLSSPIMDNIIIDIIIYKDFTWLTLKTKYLSSVIDLYDLKVKDESIDKTKIYVIRYNAMIPNFNFIKFILDVNGVEDIVNKNKNRIFNGF